MLIAAIKNKKITLGAGMNVEDMTDEQIIEVVSSEIKKRKDSIESYKQGGRQDLVDNEESEIKILIKYTIYAKL
jgi:uncharacterized protein YqeY